MSLEPTWREDYGDILKRNCPFHKTVDSLNHRDVHQDSGYFLKGQLLFSFTSRALPKPWLHLKHILCRRTSEWTGCGRTDRRPLLFQLFAVFKCKTKWEKLMMRPTAHRSRTHQDSVCFCCGSFTGNVQADDEKLFPRTVLWLTAPGQSSGERVTILRVTVNHQKKSFIKPEVVQICCNSL